MSRIRWVAEVACEYGGPAMIADVAAYELWTGAMPSKLTDRRMLHYWGQFTNELPEPYAQEGGHAYRPAESFEALQNDRDALLAAIRDHFEGARISVDDEAGETHVVLPDARQMWIELGPKSEYERACDGDEVWEHGFTTQHGTGRAVFWDKQGSGDFFVGVDEAREELVLLRTWVDEDRFDDDAKALVDSPHPSEVAAEGVTLHVRGGRAVVAYSPRSWPEMIDEDELSKALAEAEEGATADTRQKLIALFRRCFEGVPSGEVAMLSTGDCDDVAAVVPLADGTYSVTFGRYDPDDADDDEDAGADDEEAGIGEEEHDDDEDDDDDDDDDPSASWSCIWVRFSRAA